MLLFIDNFDSFTYNLVQYFQILGSQIEVIRNHRLTIEQCLSLRPDYLVIGPGPGDPSQAGISKALIHRFAKDIPILGICLGHQAIAEVYGGDVVKAKIPMHGKTSRIFHNGKGLFHQIPQGFPATRYHSLIVEPSTLPSCLEITAQTKAGEIMGLSHRLYPTLSLQFHPESILTKCGLDLLRNFLDKPSDSH